MSKLPLVLNDILDALRNKRDFNPHTWVAEKINKFNNYMIRANLSGCVISISGGIDSAVTYLLAIEASKMENSPIKKIVGICQPIHSTKRVWERALLLKDFSYTRDDGTSIGEIITIDQTEIFDKISHLVANNNTNKVPVDKKRFPDGQLKSYMRTPINYYVAQQLTACDFPSIVLGTGNKDEDIYLAYFCKAGDGVVDVQLISDLHKSEVFKVGKYLNVPHSILEAPPTADLWENQTDENELGFSYDFVELLLEYFDMSERDRFNFYKKIECSEEALIYFLDTKLMAEKIHNRNKHKLTFPVNL